MEKRRRYTREFKLEVVRLVETGWRCATAVNLFFSGCISMRAVFDSAYGFEKAVPGPSARA